MRIAIQGIKGSFHEQAAQEFFADQNYNLVESITFSDVFSAVENGVADYGIVAVENTLHGSINPVYRLLASQELHVIGEVRLQINLFLIAHHVINLNKLNLSETEILSQREALNQCEKWFANNLPKARLAETNDTAAAVRQVIANKDKFCVAVGSKQAAKLYSGAIIAGPINDEVHNYTRFFVITKNVLVNSDSNRTSIILKESTDDRAGSLYEALGVFAKYNVNLSKIDSHTLPGHRRRYSFYIDFDESANSRVGRQVLNDLNKQPWDIRILGSYRISKH